ncbi:MAG: thioredoxin domain-containing protein [Trueperaceae bacterium]
MRRTAERAATGFGAFWRLVATLACCALLGSALAAVGEPAEDLLADIADYNPSLSQDGSYRAAQDFTFRLELRGGLVYRLSGEGVLSDENVVFLADLIAAGTGYGDTIAEPVGTFLATRSADLAGRGEVAVGVEEYRLGLDVTGDNDRLAISFDLTLQEFPAELFPETRHSIGPADARFVIREFSDFQCPFCANFAGQALPMIEQRLLERGDVRFEFHHFPLDSIHANAIPAALAAECVTDANSDEDFWAFHDALFERQRAWQALNEPQPYFIQLAGEIGLSTEGAAACLDEGRFQDRVQESYDLAAGALRLTGTPSVFLNGYKIQDFLDPQAYLELIELIDAFTLDR